MHSVDIAALLARITLGGFFVLARFRFFFDPSRGSNLQRTVPVGYWDDSDNHLWFNPRRLASLTRKMRVCGWTTWAPFWAWFAALVEVGAGLFLILGLLTRTSAFGLLVVTLAATVCTAREKVAKQGPVDRIDCIGCYLWCAEPLYIVMAIIILLIGPGLYSLDSII